MNTILVEKLEGILTIAEKQGVKSAPKLINIIRHCLWEWRQFGRLPSEKAIKVIMNMR